MALADLWVSTPAQLEDKHIQQIIAFAGSGKLVDAGTASFEFRQFLTHIPSEMLIRFVDECLNSRFDGSGLALQDVINEVGRRLDFHVEHGRYRGVQGQIGFDGIWRSTGGKSIILEVKTTDAYRMDLNVVAGYRRALIQSASLTEDTSSILIVVGRNDTGDLEAQVRGSRHAWDIRLISTDALLRLLRLKENINDPLIIRKIHDILTPQEFTRIDGIVDLVFSTAEDVLYDPETAESEPEEPTQQPPVAKFHDACIKRVQTYLNTALVKQSRTTYAAPKGTLLVVCLVSREYPDKFTSGYWYAGTTPFERDHAAASDGGALGGRPRRVGRGRGTQGAGGTW